MNPTELDPELKNRRLITWKDADQNLCTVAAGILEAALNLRTTDNQVGTKAHWPGESYAPGQWDSKTNHGWWSDGWNESDANNPKDERAGSPYYQNYITALCWFSFVQMVRYRLRQARQELEANLYNQNRAIKWQKNSSRNKRGAKYRGTSKYGRSEER